MRKFSSKLHALENPLENKMGKREINWQQWVLVEVGILYIKY